MIRLLTLNVQATGPDRARLLLEWLAGRDDDVVVMTETSNGPGTAWLLGRYRAAGYHVVHQADPTGDRGCAVVSRIAVTANPDLDALCGGATIPGRVVAVVLDTRPAVTVIGTYVPSRDATQAKAEKKKVFIDSLLAGIEKLPAEMREGLVLTGDYNTITRTHHPSYKTFLAWEYDMHDRLADLGLHDATLHLHPGTQPHSWIGRTGDGYRYDYAHTATGLLPHVVASEYLHEPRTQVPALSDHAAVSLHLKVDAVNRLKVRDVAEPEQATLF